MTLVVCPFKSKFNGGVKREGRHIYSISHREYKA